MSVSTQPYADSRPPRSWGAVRVLRHVIRGLRLHIPLWTVEVLVLNASFLVAFIVRYGGRIPATYSGSRALLSALMVTTSYSIASIIFRAYRSVWRFVSIRDMATLALTSATTVGLVSAFEFAFLRDDRPIPLSALLLGGVLSYLSLTHLKMMSRLRHSRRSASGKSPVVIIGAGAAGIALARQLQIEPGRLRPAAFIDDDLHKAGRSIHGLPVVGGRAKLAEAVRRHGAGAVAIAIPSAAPAVLRALSHVASDVGVEVLMVPPFQERAPGVKRPALRELGLEDLFGRSEVGVDLELIRATVSGKRVLITGAAGSIGSEIARQLSRLDVGSLTLFDNNETGLTDLRDELAGAAPCTIKVVSVTDAAATKRVFADSRPQIVVHAAAMKHVDIVEEQPHEAALVNVSGTWICAQAAEEVGAERFLLISTDKAVAPTNVLGASKRIGERIMAGCATGPTSMFAVRFGNVVGSRGSVIPRFERQIAGGGPITVTHPDVHRYFMSIPEAVRLVLHSASIARSGHVYVLDMGEQVSISELAIRLAGIRGVRIPEDMEIVYTGLRPGERLREQLVQPGEKTAPTSHPRITELTEVHTPSSDYWREIVEQLQVMVGKANADSMRQHLLALAVGHLNGDGAAAQLEETTAEPAWNSSRGVSTPHRGSGL
ncbi:MAG: polysaccharide biosynthesis protein [Candidatus Dormibacteria bacterium]